MPIVTATPRGQRNGTVITEFTDVTSTALVTYTYPVQQKSIKIENSGVTDIFVNVGVYLNKVINPDETWEVDVSFTSFSILSNANSQEFTATASQKDVEGKAKRSEVATLGKIGKLPIKRYPMDEWLRASQTDTRVVLGRMGFFVARFALDDVVYVSEKGLFEQTFKKTSATGTVSAIAWTNAYSGRLLIAKGDNGLYQFDENGTEINLPYTHTSVINAMCYFTRVNVNAPQQILYAASNTERTIANFNFGTRVVNSTIPYPTELINATGLATDGYSLLISDDRNHIYRIDLKDGTLIEKIDLPVFCDGGISFYDGELYVADNKKCSVFVLPLGGYALHVGDTPKIKVPVADMFSKQVFNIFDSAQEPSVFYENNKFKMWFTKDSIYYAESADGITFGTATKVLGKGSGGESRVTNRSFVVKNSGTYHLFYAADNAVIVRAISSDGITWTKQADLFTKADLTSAGWSVDMMGNVGVYFDGTQWVMWIETIYGSEKWVMGRATSADLITWVVDPVWPRLEPFQRGWSVGGAQPFLHGGKHYMVMHESVGGAIPSVPNLLFSNDGLHWGKCPGNPLLNWSNSLEVDQMADPFLLEVNGSLYLYYAANSNIVGEQSFKIRLAKANITMQELIEAMS